MLEHGIWDNMSPWSQVVITLLVPEYSIRARKIEHRRPLRNTLENKSALYLPLGCFPSIAAHVQAAQLKSLSPGLEGSIFQVTTLGHQLLELCKVSQAVLAPNMSSGSVPLGHPWEGRWLGNHSPLPLQASLFTKALTVRQKPVACLQSAGVWDLR